MIYDTNIHSSECLKLAVSKVLGVGIIAGGAVVKVPQIVSVVSAKSARGLSLSSYLLDTAATAITVAYNVRSGFPLSTYGEMIFLLAQNVCSRNTEVLSLKPIDLSNLHRRSSSLSSPLTILDQHSVDSSLSLRHSPSSPTPFLPHLSFPQLFSRLFKPSRSLSPFPRKSLRSSPTTEMVRLVNFQLSSFSTRSLDASLESSPR